MIDFPASPALNDTFVAGGITYIWIGHGWANKGGRNTPPAGVTPPSSDFPAGAVMLFYQPTAPLGWTLWPIADRGLRVVSGTGQVANGGYPFSTIFGQSASGGLSLTLGTVAVGTIFELGAPSDSTTNTYFYRYVTPWGGNVAHTHALNMQLQYCDVVVGVKQ